MVEGSPICSCEKGLPQQLRKIFSKSILEVKQEKEEEDNVISGMQLFDMISLLNKYCILLSRFLYVF